MVYEYTLTVPANTPKDSPTQMDALVNPGMLTYGEVDFPAGCHNLVHIAVIEGKYQIWPRNPEEWLTADDQVIPIREYLELKRGHNKLTIKGWSEDDTFPHTIIIRFTMQRPSEEHPWKQLSDFINILKRLIGI